MCQTTPKKEGKIGDYSPDRVKFWPVAEYLPLKQGLKQYQSLLPLMFYRIAEYLPLKQGLKHDEFSAKF